jgi:hypothetical protein
MARKKGKLTILPEHIVEIKRKMKELFSIQ